MIAPDHTEQPHTRFRSSVYTKLVGLGSTAFVFVSALAMYRHEWTASIICLVGAFGLSAFELSGLAADYAKWRESVEQAVSEPDKTGD